MKKYDKIIMGTIIGGAVGSVLGMLFAPKTGKELRKGLKDKSKQAYSKGKVFKKQIEENHGEKLKKSKGRLKKFLFGCKK